MKFHGNPFVWGRAIPREQKDGEDEAKFSFRGFANAPKKSIY